MMKLSAESEKGLTRRKFFKNTALNGATAFVMGAGGLAPPKSAESSQASSKISGKTIKEALRDTRVCRTADVVVVGGGPGGIGASLTAARSGADTVLIER
jgi:NADPH-dependent 2,4-dienoyl-CoA reductase/sulfur reductase-like enzyme